MDAVVTIKQPYADRIIDGTKRYEFRRTAPKKEIDGLYIHIAGTPAVAQVHVGVNCVMTDTPDAIWERCSEYAAIMPPGMSRADFDEYFAGCETATAISLAPVPQVLEPPVLLDFLGLKTPPQAIAYAKPEPEPDMPDYVCPFCGRGSMSDYAEWEHAEFEDRAQVTCPRCGGIFDVYREWIACYTNVEPDACAMCPASTPPDRFGAGWRCRRGGCPEMREA